MMKSLIRIATLATLVAAASPATAGLILQDYENGASQIRFYSAIGQSFTAEDAHVSIGFAIRDFNPQAAPTDFDVGISLYEGAGTGGTLLASRLFTSLTKGFAGYFDLDFSSVTLTVGAVYTAIITDDTSRWGVAYADSDRYSGGTAFVFGSAANSDLRFRVTPTDVTTPLPEPASFALTGVALAALAAARRRRAGAAA